MNITEACGRLHREGLTSAKWRPGMLMIRHAGNGYRIGDDLADPPEGSVWRPDIEDDATKGCMLALVREAARDEGVWVEPPSRHDINRVWRVWSSGGIIGLGDGDTEGEALAAALVQAAERARQDTRAAGSGPHDKRLGRIENYWPHSLAATVSFEDGSVCRFYSTSFYPGWLSRCPRVGELVEVAFTPDGEVLGVWAKPE